MRLFYICLHKPSLSAAVFFRCEIEATLERLKKLERDLSTKEQELKEREQRLKMWERKLIEQSSSPVSSLLVPLHLAPPLSLGTDECSQLRRLAVHTCVSWNPIRRMDVF